MKKILALDIKYSAIQATYLASFCALMGYASVFLLDHGVSNALIGTILASISVIAIFVQPMVASFADKNKHIELRKIIEIFVFAAIILSIGILFVKDITVLLLCVFIGIATCFQAIGPLFNSLAFTFEKYGISINFGVARACGSAAYALASFALGFLVEDFGTSVIPMFYIIFNILVLIIVHIFVLPKDYVVQVETNQETLEETKQSSFIHFIIKYKKFSLFIVGVIMMYLGHTVLNNFFIQIITPIGGTESDMGTAVFLAAIVELPAMIFFEQLRKKFGCTNLLRFSFIMFAIKHTLVYFATSVFMIYVAQFLQMFCYAVFIPAGVYYVNQIINREDQIKGQSMLTMAMTASGIIANLAGGFLLDMIGVSNVLLFGAITSIIAMVIVFFTTEKVS